MVMRNFHVYKSSAGSGKTYTLVKEYLKIVLVEPFAVRNILAITFTNAAAAEMKERIIKELGQISSLAEKPDNQKAKQLLKTITDELSRHGNRPPSTDVLIKHAGIALTYLMHHYADFSVSTIDSFMHRIIRTFAFDLRLPMNFSVELDAKALLDKAVDMLLSNLGKDERLTELLISYLINQTDAGEDIRIENKIAGMARTLTEEDSAEYVQRIRQCSLPDFGKTASRLKKEVQEFEHVIVQEAGSALSLIQEKNLSMSDFYQTSRGIYAYFRHLANRNIIDKIEPNQAVVDTVGNDKWYSGKCSKDAQNSIDEIKALLTRHYNAIQHHAQKELQGYLNKRAVWQNIYPLAVLNEVEQMLEEVKTENVLLHISDFNKRISTIVREEPVPFLYERLGERYRHFMIDEFQDTSSLQWQNLLPLLENGLASGHLSLVVGDGKQAIYRFRNGDVEQFTRLPRLTGDIKGPERTGWETTLKNNYHKEPLSVNWRSAPAIIEFNNSFFAHSSLALSDKLKPVYDDVAQEKSSESPEGLVRVKFLEATEDRALPEVMIDNVLSVIRECQDVGHPLSDITVLCRANKEASMVAGALLAQNIPVISAESLLLSHSKEVGFFIALLRLLNNPGDKISAVEVLGFLLEEGIVTRPGTLHECLRATGIYADRGGKAADDLHPALENMMQTNGVMFSFRSFTHQNIYDTCESILRLFFASEEPPNPFVAFFMDAVYDFSEQNMMSYGDFISWWEEQGSKYSIVVPEGVEAVQVMTVHKSKGLQFPVVICPFAHQSVKGPTKQGFWISGEEAGVQELPAAWLTMSRKSLAGTSFEHLYDEEMEKSFLDMLNIAYVAFTRPSQKLFILTKSEKKYINRALNTLLKNFLEHSGRWQDGSNDYEFGMFEPTSASRRPAALPPDRFRSLISRPWHQSLRMKSHHMERSIVLEKDDALERGNLLHRVMEQIISAEDVEAVLQHHLNNGEITEEIRNEWLKKINELIARPEIAPCFVPGVTLKREAGMFDAGGQFYRPDRVVFFDHECVVIDYKTGKAYRKHKEQINTYSYILKSMGYPNVKKFILYLDQNIIETV
ncbi:MAG: UvrD-helicase domain-containing protein [Bacteroidales bacterium]|nr:UvrD-helicase domain-containing protein [Bacteroidales bacterium]